MENGATSTASPRASSGTSMSLKEAMNSEVYFAQEWRIAALDAKYREAENRARMWRRIAIILFIAGTVQWLAHLALG